MNPGIGTAKADLCIPQFSILMAGCVHVTDKFMQALQTLEKFEIVLNQLLLNKEEFKAKSYTNKVGQQPDHS